MFDARAVLGIVLYFKEKVLKPLRKDGYLNRCNLPDRVVVTDFVTTTFLLSNPLSPLVPTSNINLDIGEELN